MFITIIAYPTSRIKAWDLRAVALGLHWGGGAQEETYQTTDPPSDINLGPRSAPYNTPSPGAQNVLLRHYTSTASKADPGFKMSTMATLNQVSVRHSYAYRALPRVHMQAHKIRLTAHARIPLSDTTIKYTMLVISFHSKTRFIFSSAVPKLHQDISYPTSEATPLQQQINTHPDHWFKSTGHSTLYSSIVFHHYLYGGRGKIRLGGHHPF